MGVGTASNFQIYDNQFFGGLIEGLNQNTALLQSVGINMTARTLPGDFERQALVSAINGLISRRDTASLAAVDDIPVAMDESVTVKMNRKLGPVAQTLDAWKKAGLSFVADWDADGMQGLSRYLGSMAAQATSIEMLNTGLLAVSTFLINANGGSNTHTIATNGTMKTAALISALSKMGDAGDRVVAWAMHSKVYYDLMQNQADPSNGGSDLAYGVVQAARPQSLSRPIYVTDSADLVVPGTPDLYHTIGLTAGAVDLNSSEDQTLVSDIVTGGENIVGRMQGEFAYNLGVKGAKWDSANGGANPNVAAVGTGTNWDQWCSDMKDSAGVVIISG